MPNTNYIEFGVAYRNPEGRDFCGEPWVLPGLMNLEDAREAARDLALIHCSEISIIRMPAGSADDIEPPHVSWAFAKENAIEIED